MYGPLPGPQSSTDSPPSLMFLQPLHPWLPQVPRKKNKNTYFEYTHLVVSPGHGSKLGKTCIYKNQVISRGMVGQVALVFLNQRSLYICSRCCINATIDNYQPLPFVGFSHIAIGCVPEACMGRVGKSQFVNQWPLFANQIVNILVDMT